MKEKYWFLVIGAVVGFGGCYGLLVEKETQLSDATSMEASMEMDAGMQMDGMDMGAHNHPMTEVDQTLPIPAVAVVAHKDLKDGYNLEITTENFTFAPEHVNGEVLPNEGHAHLYVNGEKISRLYGNWVQVGDAQLVEGINTVEVTLNANDHSEWAVDGTHIEATLKLEK